MKTEKILLLVVGYVFACIFSGVASADKFIPGDVVEVYNTGSIGLVVRSPECGNQTGGKFNGDLGIILQGPYYCDGYYRWRVRWCSEGLEGWSAEDWLRTKYITPSQKFTVGDNVQATMGLNVRTSPPELANIQGVPAGTKGVILGGPTYGAPKGAAGCFHFWNVNYASGPQGWSAQDWLEKTITTTTTTTTTSTITTTTTITTTSTTTTTLTTTSSTIPPFAILSPVDGALEVVDDVNKCSNVIWCFNQHKTGGHVAGGGICQADDTYAWDANLNSPQWDSDGGKAVYAVAAGKVASSFGTCINAGGSYGQVLLEHESGGNKYWSGYLHLKDIQVIPEQEVTENTVLGYISNTGIDNNHLHLVLYKGTNTQGGLKSFDAQIIERGFSTTEAQWELPDEDPAKKGTQIYPLPGANKGFNVYAVVCNPNGATDIKTVKSKVSWPSPSIKYAESYGSEETNYANILQQAVDAKLLSTTERDDILNKIEVKKLCKLYATPFTLDNCDPAGMYGVTTTACDGSGCRTMENSFEYIGIVAVNVDFTSVNYGPISVNNEKTVFGDTVMETAGTAPPVKPSVQNLGNDPMDVIISATDMTGDCGGIPVVIPASVQIGKVDDEPVQHLSNVGVCYATQLACEAPVPITFTLTPPVGTCATSYSGGTVTVTGVRECCQDCTPLTVDAPETGVVGSSVLLTGTSTRPDGTIIWINIYSGSLKGIPVLYMNKTTLSGGMWSFNWSTTLFGEAGGMPLTSGQTYYINVTDNISNAYDTILLISSCVSACGTGYVPGTTCWKAMCYPTTPSCAGATYTYSPSGDNWCQQNWGSGSRCYCGIQAIIRKPDLKIAKEDITFSQEVPRKNEQITITATVHNTGNEDSSNVVVRFYDQDTKDGAQIGDSIYKTIDTIPAGGSKQVFIEWTATKTGPQRIYVDIDPDNQIPEQNEANNGDWKDIIVASYKVRVVATYYKDETQNDIQQHESIIKEALSKTTQYYLDQSYGNDYIWFSEPVYFPMNNYRSEYIEDKSTDFDNAYSPPVAYACEVENAVNREGYNTLIGFQTSKGFTLFRARAYRIRESCGNNKFLPVTFSALNVEDDHGAIAHELGHSLYGFDDLYGGGLFPRGNIGFWGLMGAGNYAIPVAPIISFNKVKAGWLSYEESAVPYSPKKINLILLQDMPYKSKVVKFNSYALIMQEFILEARSGFSYPNIINSQIIDPNNYNYMQSGVVIYQDILDIKSFLGILKPNDNSNEATLYKGSPTYKNPFAGLKVECIHGICKGDSGPTEVEISYDFLGFADLRGFILDTLNLGSLFPNQPAPWINLSYPDLDLHAYTDTGLHTGLNYSTGVYENQIPGAIASGDMIAEEWIFVPKNVSVRWVVDSHDVAQYLKEINSTENLTLNYTVSEMVYGPNPTADVVNGSVVISDCFVSAPVNKSIGAGMDQEFALVLTNVSKNFVPSKLYLTKKGAPVPSIVFPNVKVKNTGNASVDSVYVQDQIPAGFYVPQFPAKDKRFTALAGSVLANVGSGYAVDQNISRMPVFVFLESVKPNCKRNCLKITWIPPRYYKAVLQGQNISIDFSNISKSNIGRTLKGNESIIISYGIFAQKDYVFEAGNLTTNTYTRVVDLLGLYEDKTIKQRLELILRR